MSVTIISHYLPAGTQIKLMKLGEKKFINYTTKVRVDFTQADMVFGYPSENGIAFQYMGYIICVEDWKIGNIWEDKCTCEGKGEKEVGMYGKAKGRAWRTHCCKPSVCKFKK